MKANQTWQEMLQDNIRDQLLAAGDQTATQIRATLSDTWDLQAGQVFEALAALVAAGRARRVKQYYRAVVGIPIFKFDPSLPCLNYDGVRMVSGHSFAEDICVFCNQPLASAATICPARGSR